MSRNRVWKLSVTVVFWVQEGVFSWSLTGREPGARSSETGETCLPAYSGKLVPRKISLLLGLWALGC